MHRYIFFRTGEPQALIGKGLVSLLSPSAFTFAADLFAAYEGGALCTPLTIYIADCAVSELTLDTEALKVGVSQSASACKHACLVAFARVR